MTNRSAGGIRAQFSTALGMTLVILVVGLPSAVLLGQEESRSQVSTSVDEIARSVDSAHECSISIHGAPQEDVGQWLVAYSASGSDCDEAADELARLGSLVNVVFVRRPNLAQVSALTAQMIRSVASSYSCRVTVRDQPRLDETSSQWVVSYFASGLDCEEASQELRQRGAPLRIAFLWVPDRQDLIGNPIG